MSIAAGKIHMGILQTWARGMPYCEVPDCRYTMVGFRWSERVYLPRFAASRSYATRMICGV